MATRASSPARLLMAWEWLVLVAILPAVLFPSPLRSLALLALPALWLLRRLATGHFLPPTPLNGTLLLFGLTLLVSLLATLDRAVSAPRVAGLVFGMAVYFAAAGGAGQSARRLWWGVALFLGSGAALALLSMVGTRWSSSKLPLVGYLLVRLPQRLVSLPGAEEGFSPNQVAGSLLWLAPVAIALAAAFLGRGRGLSGWKGAAAGLAVWLAAGLLTLVLLLTQSRSGFIGLAVGLAFLGLALAWQRRRLAIGLAVVALVAVGAAAARLDREQVMAYLNEETQGPTGSNQPIAAIESRLAIWSRATAGIEDFPLTGMGVGVFRHVQPALYPLFDFRLDDDVAHAHNHWLQAALDLGLPGLVGYAALWLGSAGMLWQVWSRSDSPWQRALALGSATALLAYNIFGLLDAVALGAKPGFLLWLLWGLVAGLHRQVVAQPAAGA